MKSPGNSCMIKNEHNILTYSKLFSGNSVPKNLDTSHCFQSYLWLKELFRPCINTCQIIPQSKSLFIAHHITLTYAFDYSTNITPVFHKIIMITVTSIIKRKNITTPIRIIFLRCSRSHIFLLAFDVITAN